MLEEEQIRPGYTRVTEILSPYSKIREAMERNPAAVERMRIIGSEVHKAIYDFNNFIPPTLSPEAQPYFDSYLYWVQETKTKNLMNENRYYDDLLKITGCVDAVVKFPYEDWNVMIDWKCTASASKDMKTSWMYQGVFYHYLMMQNNIPEIGDRFLFVQLDRNGDLPKVTEYNYSSKLMADCEAQVRAYRCYNPL